MANGKMSFFQVPDGTVVETVYVRLADGRIVPRTPEELEAMPDELVPSVQLPSST